jgi:hypothetical protein
MSEMNQLGVHPQATAILQLLKYRVVDDNLTIDDLYKKGTILCAAWYNGRERGICIYTASRMTTEYRHILVFGEHRNSDAIFLDTWSGTDDINPPHHTNIEFTEQVYKLRKFFGPFAMTPVHDAIVDTINEWTHRIKRENSKVVISCLGCGEVYDLESARASLIEYDGCEICTDSIALSLEDVK